MKIVAIGVGVLVALFVGSEAIVGALGAFGVIDTGKDSTKGDGGRGQAQPRPDGFVRVRRVIDGDTVVLTRFGKTRLIGVDTPEEGRCYETEATRFTRRRLEGKRVGYEFDEDRKDRYRRTLAYLYRGDGMHNLALVEKGFAKALAIYPNLRYSSRFLEAERNAEERQVGLFSGECERRRELRAEQRKRERARARARERRLRAELRRQRAKENRRRQAAERRAEREAQMESDGGSSGGASVPENCDEVDGPIPSPPGDPTNLDANGDGEACE